VRRRRECSDCSTRFTTYEYVEAQNLQVLKRGGSVQDFDRSKLKGSIKVACAKRPVSASDIEELVNAIEDELSSGAGLEVQSDLIGQKVMERLKPLDRGAYVRFASVYRNFQDADEFQEFVDEMNARALEEARAHNQVELPFSGG